MNVAYNNEQKNKKYLILNIFIVILVADTVVGKGILEKLKESLLSNTIKFPVANFKLQGIKLIIITLCLLFAF